VIPTVAHPPGAAAEIAHRPIAAPPLAPSIPGGPGGGAPAIGPAVAAGVDVTLPLSPMRRTIARRLTEAKQTIPHFYVTMDAQADALWAFHQQVKDQLDVKVTLNDLVLKLTAAALHNLPEANASFTDQGIVRHGAVHLGIAVSIEDGLVTPVLRNADTKTLGTIARESRDLIERARTRKLRGDEFTGGTFSVSNMGMYGVKSFSAVINPPESGILAVGAMEKRAVVGPDDAISVRRVMTLTLSADHRVVDGALAARLLAEIVRIAEHPLTMVL
jgi:pyruvate dehydrogenase E2 component (dihydrolipoamide acetyltransferase)